jgi:hypothetical protein
VAEAANCGGQVDAAGQELRGVEVAQVLQRRFDVELVGELSVGVGEVVRVPRPHAQRVWGEHEGVVGQGEPGWLERGKAGPVEACE